MISFLTTNASVLNLCSITIAHTHFTSKELKRKTFVLNSQPVISCLKLTTKTLEQGVKYVQS